MFFNDKQKQQLTYFITSCHQTGKDPQTEANKLFHKVLDKLEVNTRPYRLAFSVPSGFYVLHSTQEAIDILTSQEAANG